ncbi:hypothetical protein F5Y18DRAFT_431940 [Xylariaceae sp. FL1019]|nr:hypothetical protein F5Y18DRAFT_431940 [Xylariaceae sp. FL1019]
MDTGYVENVEDADSTGAVHWMANIYPEIPESDDNRENDEPGEWVLEPKPETYMTDKFEENCGAILFKITTEEVCILSSESHYTLPQGRRRCNESRAAAAVRIARERTGLAVYHVPIDTFCGDSHGPASERADPEIGMTRDPEFLVGCYEPIRLQQQHFENGNLKLTWWYILAVQEAKEELLAAHELEARTG